MILATIIAGSAVGLAIILMVVIVALDGHRHRRGR